MNKYITVEEAKAMNKKMNGMNGWDHKRWYAEDPVAILGETKTQYLVCDCGIKTISADEYEDVMITRKDVVNVDAIRTIGCASTNDILGKVEVRRISKKNVKNLNGVRSWIEYLNQ